MQQNSHAIAVTGQGGYRSMGFARSLAFMGRPFGVEAWGTPVLLREIEGADGAFDATGAYPLCQFGPEPDLRAGVEVLRSAGAVSLVLVADPLGAAGPEHLRQAFDMCRPFKTHHVWDREAGSFAPSRHHRERIRRGARRNRVCRVSLRDPAWLARWTELYDGLVLRKGLTGPHSFPPASFTALAELPGHELIVFAATGLEGGVEGMQLWIQADGRAYSHLTAVSPSGYRSGAAYALLAGAMEHFSDCSVIDLGGGAGLEDRADDGLAAFKRGFANASVTAQLCCSILDRATYAVLSRGLAGDFFPLYRQARR